MSFAPPSAPLLPRGAVNPAGLRRVLLVKLSSLGDVVHALPLIEALRAGLGTDAFLGWAVRDRFAPLLQGNPHLDAAYVLSGSGWGETAAFGKGLGGAGPWDAALDAQGLFVSGALTRMSGAGLRIGLDRNREGNRFFLTHPVVPGRQRAHTVDVLLGFCDAIGVPRVAPRPQRYLAEAEAELAEMLFADAGGRDGAPWAGFIVGASTADKAWPTERWAEAAQGLSKRGVRVALIGGPGEAEAAGAIVAQSAGSIAANWVGQTPLPLLASVLARCGVVIGGDSGPTHLAVAVGTPVVGLYGVTDPARTGPDWGPAPSITLDFAEADAPPAQRRPRHSALTDAIARIPAAAAVDAACMLLSAAPGKGLQ